VLTYDVQGQGGGETLPHEPLPSTPSHHDANPRSEGAKVSADNPYWQLFDRAVDRRTATPGRTSKIAIIGHSMGAAAVSKVPGIDKRVEAVDSMLVVPRASTHVEHTDIPLVLPASRYGQDLSSHYVQAWLDRYLKHRSNDSALTASTLRYLEPVGNGRWQPVTLHRGSLRLTPRRLSLSKPRLWFRRRLRGTIGHDHRHTVPDGSRVLPRHSR
jgi:hypothetical protein